jgi:hypothetical protein
VSTVPFGSAAEFVRFAWTVRAEFGHGVEWTSPGGHRSDLANNFTVVRFLNDF